MNLDIETEHVAMRAEWHHTIEDWVTLCRQRHPGVGALELTLRHADAAAAAEQVDAVATAGQHVLRGCAKAKVMSVALGDALEILERELCASEVVGERGPVRRQSSS